MKYILYTDFKIWKIPTFKTIFIFNAIIGITTAVSKWNVIYIINFLIGQFINKIN